MHDTSMPRLGAAITALTLSGCTLLLIAALLRRRGTATRAAPSTRPPAAAPSRGKKKVRFLEQPLTPTRPQAPAAASSESEMQRRNGTSGDERATGRAAPAPNRSALYSGMLRYRAQMATSMIYGA